MKYSVTVSQCYSATVRYCSVSIHCVLFREHEPCVKCYVNSELSRSEQLKCNLNQTKLQKFGYSPTCLNTGVSIWLIFQRTELNQ